MKTNGNTAAISDNDGRKFTVCIADISPEEAEHMLQRMAHNRPAKDRKVMRIAEAISEGKYMLNGQPLIEDSSGSLLDGQHRLQACVRARKPIRTFMVQGVSPEVFPTLDLFERKLAEILIAEYGLEIARAGTTASVINLSYALRHTHNTHTKDFPSTWTALEYYNAERIKIDQRTVEAFEKFKTKILPTAKLIALWHEFSVVNSDLARQFFISMCGLSHDIAPFDQLREMFMADMPKPAKRRISQRIKLAYCIRAFNAVLAGTEVKFKMKRGEEFPVIGLEKVSSQGENSMSPQKDGLSIEGSPKENN